MKHSDLVPTPGVVLLEFVMADCAPCKLMVPTMKKLESAFPDVVFSYLSASVVPETAVRYSVTAFPTFLLFIDGECKERLVGRQTYARMERLLLAASGK